MTCYYLDTSIAVHLLQRLPAVTRWFDSVDAREPGSLVSSRLLRTELTRFLRHTGTPVADRDVVLDKVALVPISESILIAAEAITEHVKTLDAIHLASALALGRDVVVISNDTNVNRVADLLGLHSFDPISAEDFSA